MPTPLTPCVSAASALRAVPLCSSRDADRAWEKMDGLRVDGARWKVDYATKKVSAAWMANSKCSRIGQAPPVHIVGESPRWVPSPAPLHLLSP